MKNTLLALAAVVCCCLLCSWFVAESRAESFGSSSDASMNTHLKIDQDGTITVTQRFRNFPNRWSFYFENEYTSNAPFSMDNNLPEIVEAQIDGKKSSRVLPVRTSLPTFLFSPMSQDCTSIRWSIK